MIKKKYNIRNGYRIRTQNAPYVDTQPNGVIYQPDVYELAFYLARKAGAKYLIDIGAGEGEKLIPISSELEVIAVDCETNIVALRSNLPNAKVIEHNLEKGLPYLSVDILKQAVVISSDVIEHIVEPHKYLRDLARVSKISPYLLISTPDRTRARGAEDFGPPANPFHVREWTIDELYGLLLDYGVENNIGYTVSNNQDLFKGTILAIAGSESKFEKSKDVSVKCIMTSYNEEDIIEASVTHALREGMNIHIIDNWSKDNTYRILKRLAKQHNNLVVERYPAKKPKSDLYEWANLLDRVSEIAYRSEEDWIVHNDSDEFRISPWKNITVQQAISYVDSLGYNAIDITVMDFRPTKDGFTQKDDPAIFFNEFEFTQLESYLQQIKIWKNITKVDLSSTGGHIAKFEGQRVYPLKFASKHYPLRSSSQAYKKIFSDRNNRITSEEKLKGWHTQYAKYKTEDNFIWNEKNLSKFTQGNYYNDFIVERLSGIGILKRY